MRLSLENSLRPFGVCLGGGAYRGRVDSSRPCPSAAFRMAEVSVSLTSINVRLRRKHALSAAELRIQALGIGCFLPPCEPWGLNSGYLSSLQILPCLIINKSKLRTSHQPLGRPQQGTCSLFPVPGWGKSLC